MKIAVLVKPVLDCGIELLINEQEKKVVHKDQLPTYIVNPADRAALETAMTVKEKIKDTQILAMSFGSPSNEKAVCHALARGADRGVLIKDGTGTERDASFVAAVLAKCLAPEDVDLILCGNRTVDHGMGCVGPFVAENLNLPQISGAVKVTIASDKRKATVQRRMEKGNREMIECVLPAVISVDPMIANPRYVSVCSQKLASEIPFDTIFVESLCVNEAIHSRTRLLKLETPRPRPKRTFIPDSKLSVTERMKLITMGGITKKEDTKILMGSPEIIADGIITFLQERGFIE